MPLQPGTTLGQYTILGQLGRGGMATVYRAMQTSLNRPVAIKVLPDFFAEEPSFRERFKQEAVSVAQFRHPNILNVYEYAESDGLRYIVTELVDGGTLADKMGRALPITEVVRLLTPIASAVDYAHARGVIHRDIKPSNILIASDGTPVLADFGMALNDGALQRVTQTGSMIGTPEYMAPEQAAGEDASAASDLYALAIMAYEMLTGRVPYTGTTPLSILLAHLNTPLPPPREIEPSVPLGVETVLTKALAKKPGERYTSAALFVQALGDAAATPEQDAPTVRRAEARAAAAGGTPPTSAAAKAETPPPAEPPKTPSPADGPPPPSKLRRPPILAGVAVAVVAIAAVVVYALSSGGGGSKQPAAQAQAPASVTSVPVATVAPTAAPPIAPVGGQAPPPTPTGPSYEDDFSDPNRSAFGISRGPASTATGIDFDREIQDGALVIKLIKGPAGRSFLSPAGERLTPNSPLGVRTPGGYSVDVDAKAQGKVGQLEYGIALSPDNGDGMRIIALPGSSIVVVTQVQGDKVTVLNRAQNAAVTTGETVNHLRVEVRGSSIRVLINGKQIGTYADPTLNQRPTSVFLLSGIEGSPLRAGDDARITFDNFKLAALN